MVSAAHPSLDFRALDSVRIHNLVERAAHALASASQDVGVDHRRANVLMPEELLHRSDVVSVLKKVCGEAVPGRCDRRRAFLWPLNVQPS